MKLAELLADTRQQIPPSPVESKLKARPSDKKVTARAHELLTKHGAALCVEYQHEDTLRTVFTLSNQKTIDPSELLKAAKAPYFRLYLKSGETIKQGGLIPPCLTYEAQWDAMSEEDKKVMEELGFKKESLDFQQG